MTTAIVLLLLAVLVFGGIGLFVEAASWAIFIAIALIVVGAVMGVTGRNRGRAI